MANFAGLKKLGSETLEYMMRHRPTPDLELSAGLHDVGELFPGIYEKGVKSYTTHNPKVDEESMQAIMAAQGNPEALVDIYRAVPKGVRDFNTGDWVTTSKAYAKEHGQHALNGEYDLIGTRARAADISSPGDSIAEQGYWGMPVKGMVTKGLLPILGGGAVTLAMSPDEAEASVTPSIGKIVKNAVENGRNYAGKHAGTLDSEVAAKQLAEHGGYKGVNGYFTQHGIVHRAEEQPNSKDFPWSTDQIAAMYHNIYDLPDTVLVPNVLGVNPNATEALWNPMYGGKSLYMPIVPYKDGFKGLTIFDPEASHVKKLLKDKGYWEGGSTSSIFTPNQQAPVLQVGSGPFSAVNSPMGTLANNPEWRKRFGSAGVAGALTLIPTATEGSLPDDPEQIGGAIGYLARSTGNPAQDELVSAAQGQELGAPVTWGDVKHGLSFGTRAALEGLGGLADMGPNAVANAIISPFTDYRFKNPGITIADAMGLDRPWNGAEQTMYGLERGAADALPFIAGGSALARGGTAAAKKAGKWLADNPRAQALFGGALGMLGEGE